MKTTTNQSNLIRVAAALLLLLPMLMGNTNFHTDAKWGFYGHRLINRMAVFTLPPELIGFYKTHLSYIAEHAVDPDKRRYATRHEAVRHYIDLDEWGVPPFDSLPRDWTGVLLQHATLLIVATTGNDTIVLSPNQGLSSDTFVYSVKMPGQSDFLLKLPFSDYRGFFGRHILPMYYEDEWFLPADSLPVFWGDSWPAGISVKEVWVKDGFSRHGILPYYLPQIQRQLTDAFSKKDIGKILRLSAEIGHYIGDAHVPLHTTKNYNGQLTDQTGIHAFWESRLPEIFAENSYDFFVGNAEYISDPRNTYWQIVFESHALVDSVLAVEMALRNSFPPDRQFCFEERLGQTLRMPCLDFSTAYHQNLGGMVEARMKQAIRMIGSAWYTAWVNAGQPELPGVGLGDDFIQAEILEDQQIEQLTKKGVQLGRSHE